MCAAQCPTKEFAKGMVGFFYLQYASWPARAWGNMSTPLHGGCHSKGMAGHGRHTCFVGLDSLIRNITLDNVAIHFSLRWRSGSSNRRRTDSFCIVSEYRKRIPKQVQCSTGNETKALQKLCHAMISSLFNYLQTICRQHAQRAQSDIGPSMRSLGHGKSNLLWTNHIWCISSHCLVWNGVYPTGSSLLLCFCPFPMYMRMSRSWWERSNAGFQSCRKDGQFGRTTRLTSPDTIPASKGRYYYCTRY